VKEGVAKTGGVGILLGDQPGPVIALRLMWMDLQLRKEWNSHGLQRPLLSLIIKLQGSCMPEVTIHMSPY